MAIWQERVARDPVKNVVHPERIIASCFGKYI
jgi:hypothetical protein